MSLENLPSWRLYDRHHDNDPPISMLTLRLTIHLWLASTFPTIYRIFFLLEIAPKLLSTTKPNCFPCKLTFHPLFLTLQMYSNHDITILFLSSSISHDPPRNASLAPKSHVFFLLGQHILMNASLDLSNTYFFFPLPSGLLSSTPKSLSLTEALQIIISHLNLCLRAQSIFITSWVTSKFWSLSFPSSAYPLFLQPYSSPCGTLAPPHNFPLVRDLPGLFLSFESDPLTFHRSWVHIFLWV